MNGHAGEPTVGEAVAPEPDDAIPDERAELRQEPGLAHARLADEEHDAAPAGGELVETRP